MAWDVKTIGIIGTGIMGTGIGQALAVGGYRVLLYDATDGAAERSREKMEHGHYGVRRGVEIGKVTAADAEAMLARVGVCGSLEETAAASDLMVEAVPEDIALKIRTFRALDRLARPGTILASNTAGLSIAALAAATDRPGRVIGWHWFQPAQIMRLTEIVVHAEVAPETSATVVAISEACGKRPQVVQDQPFQWGFVANRINRKVIEEAERVVAEGLATRQQVDTIMRDGFRWPVGPFDDSWEER